MNGGHTTTFLSQINTEETWMDPGKRGNSVFNIVAMQRDTFVLEREGPSQGIISEDPEMIAVRTLLLRRIRQALGAA